MSSITSKLKTEDLNEKIKIFEQKTNKDFIEYYNKYLPKLIYFISRICNNDVYLAEDIAVGSFIKALDKIDDERGGFDPNKARFSTWLFTISKNEAFQALNKLNKTVSIDNAIDEDGTTIKDFLHDETISTPMEIDVVELNNKKGNILKERISNLKEPYKEVIELRELKNMSYRDMTIYFKHEKDIFLDSQIFDSKNYNSETNIITLEDPEKATESDLEKMVSILKIEDVYGNDVEYDIIEKDKHGLISKIRIPIGLYKVRATIPFNMSTLKSQIRNGRILLRDMVENDFDSLNKMYL